ncbi:helix-turn-helix domain-containing protein [Clostridium nigeriense]|uniref:helix-turn-helix domain-containing protein n=1 Tax=Clostridium nigeriense TaxID=1805470 RepID=UPI003D3328DB
MISKRIQEQRKIKGLTQEQLAESLNVSRQAVSKWESNQSLPEIDRVILMSEIFNVSTDYLLKGITIEDSKNNNLKDYSLLGTIFISIGLILTITLWYEYQTSLSIAIGLIIQIIGIFLTLSSNIKTFKNYKIKILISFCLIPFIPLSLLINLFFNKSLGLILTLKAPIPFIFFGLYVVIGLIGSIMINKYLKK